MCEEEDEKDKKDSLQKKINELNYEINKCKEERNNLNKMKLHYDKLKSKLNSDIEMFNKQKEEFKKYMINEIGKIKIKQEKYKTNNKIIKNLRSENENLNRKYQQSKDIIESLKKQIYELQYKTKNNNNILSLKQYLNKQDINKIEYISKKEKLCRNRSSLGLIKYKGDKIVLDKKRLNTFITEKELYSVRANTKEKEKDEESFEIHTTIQNKKIKFMNCKRKKNNSKAYEADNYLKRNSTIDVIDNTNDNKNIITQEKYNNILKLINKSFRKSNKEQNDKSFIGNGKTNLLKVNNTKIEKKKIIKKCKSNLNMNKNISEKKKEQKCNIKYIEKNSNISNDINNNKLTLEEYEFKIPEKYKDKKYKLTKSLKAGDKIINIYDDNKKEIIFPSGVRKEIYKDGYQIIFFTNGDVKQNYPNGKSIYYFNQAKTVQTKFKNGVFVIKFENNQVEKHFPDGKKQILFPDGSEKIFLNDENE